MVQEHEQHLLPLLERHGYAPLAEKRSWKLVAEQVIGCESLSSGEPVPKISQESSCLPSVLPKPGDYAPGQ